MITRRLNKALVLDTAVDLLNARGSGGSLTLTELAGALHVRVPSLYNHVAGLEGLHQDLRLRAGRELLEAVRAAAFGLTGAEALNAMGHAYRRFAHAQPGLYPFSVIAPEPDEREAQALADEWLQMLLLIMATVGLTGPKALHAIRGYRALLHGFVTLEAVGGYKLPMDSDKSFHWLLQTYLAGVQP